MEKCCSKCAWFRDGRCMNPNGSLQIKTEGINKRFNQAESVIIDFFEDGTADEIIEESFNGGLHIDKDDLFEDLPRMSEKTKNEIIKRIRNFLFDDYIRDAKETASNNLYKVMMREAKQIQERESWIRIANPDNFCCSDYWR